MTVCRFGHFARSYTRNAVMKSVLEGMGAQVVDVHSSAALPWRWSQLAAQLRRVSFDLMFVPFPGFTDVPLARLLSRGRPVVFDPFIGICETLQDRGRARPGSARDRLAHLCEWFGLWCAHRVLVDTYAHGHYFAEHTGVSASKFCRVRLAIPESDEPGKAQAEWRPGATRVLFYGSYVPLQGAETIVRAIAGLPATADVQVVMVGDGQTRSATEALAADLKVSPNRLQFLPKLEYSDLRETLKTAEVGLGIFGVSPKASRVIPNKIYDYLAAGLVTITAESSAISEILSPDKDVLTVAAGDAEALRQSLQRVIADEHLRKSIGREARATYEREMTRRNVSMDMQAVLAEVGLRLRTSRSRS